MANASQLRKFNLRFGAAGASLTIAFVLMFAGSPAAQAQTFNVIHNFAGGSGGATPRAGLTINGANLYGTTFTGGRGACMSGPPGCGTVFQLKQRGSNWTFNPLYSFSGAGGDGANPWGRVIFGPDGALYGTTFYEGSNGYGTVFELRPLPTVCKTVLCPWTETVLYDFSRGNNGYLPIGDLIFDHAGNIYGTASLGGSSDQGVVYELTFSHGSWAESVLYSFIGGSDGGYPDSGVIFDNADNNLYGTTAVGGTGGGGTGGTVFQLMPAGPPWMENVIYNFQNGSDGGYPNAGLIFDQSGNNLYGATTRGGTGGGGTVYELSRSGSGWTFNPLYNFTGFTGSGFCPTGNDGPGPWSSLVMDRAGNLYGTTCSDGADGYGNVFELTPSRGGWIYTDLHDFSGGSDGAYPISNVVFDGSGNLYGTASAGGSGTCNVNGVTGCGVVWEITP